jgi:uncharacterized membrane protein YphA (DoxX/SURF4 family)
MAYSHARLRKCLALVRIVTGATFLVFGSYKISSMEFARVGFPQFLWDATHGSAVGFYASLLNTIVSNNMSKYAVLVGFVELFIGIGLLLGLVVRPIAVLGMLYSVNLILATWMAPGADQPLWRHLDGEMRHIALFLLFLLFGVGHAGENWGLGALYHRRRHLRWEQSNAPQPADLPDRDFDATRDPEEDATRYPELDDNEEGLPIPSAALPRRSY